MPPQTDLRPPRRRAALPALAVAAGLVLVVAACSSDDGDATSGTTTSAAPVVESLPTTVPPESTTTLPPPTADLSAVAVGLDEVAVLRSPTAMATRSGSDDLYLTEQGGKVRRIEVDVELDDDEEVERVSYRLAREDVLDLEDETEADGEQGLLGLVFSSDGRTLYVDYTDEDVVTHVTQFEMDGDRADTDTRRDVLSQQQPFTNHNGGQLAIGPDGYLYIGLGDGGSAGDPEGNGQNPATLLGSIVRVDPQLATEDVPYGIPATNPFVGDPAGADEVFLFGVRNPWRFSFDPATGDLWVADVGQDQVEEITWLPATEGGAGRGANLGWARMEGNQVFSGTGEPAGHVGPILTYPHDGGACSIVGGYVYRGEAIPALQGAYVYGDWCTGEVRALVAQEGRVIDDQPIGLTVPGLTSFGVDVDGELWVLSQEGPVSRIVPA